MAYDSRTYGILIASPSDVKEEREAAVREENRDIPRDIPGSSCLATERLERWPAVSGAKPLSGDLAGWYRLRTGDYRVRFRIEGETVVVAKIGHRSEFYEDRAP